MRRKILYALSLAAVIALFAVVAFQSWGYDDEMFNFNHVERAESLGDLIKFINGTDIHPYGMYVINYIMLKALGSWPAVKAASGVFCALCLWLFWYVVSRNITEKSALVLSYILLCLNPTLLLWCTSVRWYTYFTPMVCAMTLLVMNAGSKTLKGSWLWAIYFLTCLVMFHVNYISSVIIIISFLFMLHGRKEFLRSEWKYVVVFGALSLCLVSYQAYILLTVHYINGKGFTFPPKFSVGAAQNYLCGQAVVPVSPEGIAFILANIIMLIAFLKYAVKILKHRGNSFLVITYAALMITCPGNSTSSGARNFSVLSPETGMFLTNVYSEIKSRLLKMFVLLLYAAGTATGIYNVVTHTNTSKATYDMPYVAIISYADTFDPERKAMFISDFGVLDYHAKKIYSNATSTASDSLIDDVRKWKGKIIAVQTHNPGSRYGRHYAEYLSFLAELENSKNCTVKEIGRDKYAWFKQKFSKDLPEYYAQVYFIDNGDKQ